MPDPIEHATGIERRELEAIAAGNDVSYLAIILLLYKSLLNINMMGLIWLLLFTSINVLSML